MTLCKKCDIADLCRGADSCIGATINRLLKATEAKIWAEHLADFNGDEKLARKAVDMMRAKIQEMIAQNRKH